MVIWLIGLSGSGKTTVGKYLYRKIKSENPSTVLIDGDEIREIFKHNIGNDPYSVEGRKINADRITKLCSWLDNQGINVICCILSIFEESRIWNRKNYSDYREIYLQTNNETLSKRRTLYNDARKKLIKNVVGVDIPFIPPENYDFTFNTDGNYSAEEIAQEIFNNLS